MIEKSIDAELIKGNDINAIQHIWGYFKDIANDKERETYYKKLERYENLYSSNKPIKEYLLELSVKYDMEYLIKSLYFYI